ncbi:MAG: 50S ribosomal protein L21 [Lentisphaerae bacterium]|nr:50S ribosomal protein L21 [Lentisphaerota bacterium]
MKSYAVIETGGKQYRVTAGDKLKVERLAAETGAKITLQPVLALNHAEQFTLGAPHVAGAKVTATVLRHLRGRKLVVFKKKRRKGYALKKGHRQELTELQIESLA